MLRKIPLMDRFGRGQERPEQGVLVTGQVAGIGFTHRALSGLRVFLVAAYTERAFLPLNRLLKHPLRSS